MLLQNIDMNLFVVFRAIYQEAHITRAARVLGLTQPAVSHSLSRLRELYHDPLFVRRGLRMEPTPLARALFPKISEALDLLQLSLPAARMNFDPQATRQNFLVATRDPLEAFFLPQLMQIMTREAPFSQLTSLRIKRQDLEQELSSGGLDLAFDVLVPVAPSLRFQKIMEDEWVVVGRRGHPLLQEELSLGLYLTAQHIVVSSRRSGLSLEDYQFKRRNLERRIAMRCQHLFAAIRTASSTDLLLTLPQHFVTSLGLDLPLDQAPLPVPCSLPAVAMYWHERQDQNPVSIWLRSKVTQVATQIFGNPQVRFHVVGPPENI